MPGPLRLVHAASREQNKPCTRHLVHFHHIVESPGGTREVDEVDDFGLFTIDEMLAAFSAVGLAATYDTSWSETSGDGLYVASRPG